MKPLSPAELESLGAKADAAMPGPWQACQANAGNCRCRIVWSLPLDRPIETLEEHPRLEKHNMDFIATANPDTVKRLLAMVAEARALMESIVECQGEDAFNEARDVLVRWNGAE